MSPPGSWVQHGSVAGRTLCGRPETHAWVVLNQWGSLHSVTCRQCVRCLQASGDMPRAEHDTVF